MSFKEITNEIFVVETFDGEAYLGRVRLEEDSVVIYTGFTGRPPIIPADEVQSMTLARHRSDVEVIA